MTSALPTEIGDDEVIKLTQPIIDAVKRALTMYLAEHLVDDGEQLGKALSARADARERMDRWHADGRPVDNDVTSSMFAARQRTARTLLRAAAIELITTHVLGLEVRLLRRMERKIDGGRVAMQTGLIDVIVDGVMEALRECDALRGITRSRLEFSAQTEVTDFSESAERRKLEALLHEEIEIALDAAAE